MTIESTLSVPNNVVLNLLWRGVLFPLLDSGLPVTTQPMVQKWCLVTSGLAMEGLHATRKASHVHGHVGASGLMEGVSSPPTWCLM